MFYANNSISNAISNLLYILLAMTHLIIVIESIYQKVAQSKFIENLSKFDRLFSSKAKVQISYNNEKIEILKRFCMIATIVIIIYINFLYTTYNRNLYYNFVRVSVFSYITTNLRAIQLVFLVCLLRRRLILINKELKDIQDVQRIECNTQCGLISNHLSVNDRIMNLKQMYHELYESCECLNVAFGWSISSSSFF